MSSKEHKKKKYSHYTDSIDDNEVTEDSGNMDKIISKLSTKYNPENNNSGNIDEILQIDKKPDEMKMDNSINISKLLNSNIKDHETSQENENSLISDTSNSKDNATTPKDMSIEMNLENDLKEKLEKQEKKNNNSNINFIKIFKNFEAKDPNLSSLSAHLDNSRYYLNKQNDKKIVPVEITNLGEKDSEKLKNKILLSEKKNKKEKEKNTKNENKKNKTRNKPSSSKGVNSSIDNINKTMSTLYQKKCLFGFDCSCDCEITNRRKWRRRFRNCSIITLARDIFISIVIISAVGFYITIFFLT